ncbi:MAG: hypothetical protein H6618_02750 [Deltaproteobacteria bacterium]|nr:hypothetical protein [Deltaproteobacteria bacterium]
MITDTCVKWTHLNIPVLCLLLNSCFSPLLNQAPSPTEMTEDLEIFTAPASEQDRAGSSEDQESAEKARHLAYASRLLNPSEAFIPGKDEIFLQALSDQPAPGSAAEAALFVGLLRNFLWLREGAEDFNRPVSNAEGAEDPIRHQTGPDSLEQMAQRRQIDLPAALLSNPLLKSASLQTMLLRALRLGRKQSKEFLSGIQNAIRQNMEEWERLNQDLSQSPQENTNSDDSTDSQQSPTYGTTGSALPFDEETISTHETKLKEALALSERRQYPEALTILKTIPQDSLYQAEATDKIREISNLAVQELRHKAAKAFQSASPISDQATRSAYLEEAREHLESALKDFPDSDQLRTVRKNLDMINKALGRHAQE